MKENKVALVDKWGSVWCYMKEDEFGYYSLPDDFSLDNFSIGDELKVVEL